MSWKYTSDSLPLQEKRKADKYFNTNVKLCKKIANVRTELNQIERQLEIKEQECLEANRRIKRIKDFNGRKDE